MHERESGWDAFPPSWGRVSALRLGGPLRSLRAAIQNKRCPLREGRAAEGRGLLQNWSPAPLNSVSGAVERCYFLQQASQVLASPLQHSAHLSLQQVLQAETLVQEDRVAMAVTARRVRIVFMMLDELFDIRFYL